MENRQTTEGASHPGRAAPWAHSNAQTEVFQWRGQPVISVDTKQKERVGDFQQGGRAWPPAGQPQLVRVSDCVDRAVGKAMPSGVYDFPPGTSQRHTIEHRLFCHITQNWRGRPLRNRMAVVQLIAATTTKTGLKVECALDERTYEKGRKIGKAEMASLDITTDPFHPEWNYTIKPRRPPS